MTALALRSSLILVVEFHAVCRCTICGAQVDSEARIPGITMMVRVDIVTKAVTSNPQTDIVTKAVTSNPQTTCVHAFIWEFLEISLSSTFLSLSLSRSLPLSLARSLSFVYQIVTSTNQVVQQRWTFACFGDD